MTNKELIELLAKLDQHYITKEEFETEVFRYTSSRFASKMELLDAVGRIEALVIEQSRNDKLIQDVHAMTVTISEQTARQASSLDHLNQELAKAKRDQPTNFWYGIPYPIRAIISFAGAWLLLIISTTMIGENMDTFMKENGLYVFFANAILSLVTSRKWGNSDE